MWYFAWILGVLLACAFGIINVLWLEAQESLEQDSVVLDPLTKTLIRFEFLSILKDKIKQSHFEHRPFCLFMMSLDSLSGRSIAVDAEKGDPVRVEYTSIFRGVLPKENTILARYDACTFAALLPNTHRSTAESFAESICRISESRSASPPERVAVNIGIAECRPDLFKRCGEDLDLAFNTLLKNADQAMQRARSQGPNRHVIVVARPSSEHV